MEEKEKKKKKKERKIKENEEKPKRKKKKIKSWGREGKRRFSQCSDDRISIVRELKLVHVTRATRGYRNLNISSKLQEVGVFSYIGSSLFKSRK